MASSTRSRVTLKECERLLGDAKKCATAMVGLAEVEGNQMKIKEASQRLERDIAPLAKEVQRALLGGEQQQQQQQQQENTANREELFYQAPNPDGSTNDDMEALISSSEDLLRQSMSLCVETEQIGNTTIHQMGQQREQLQNTRFNIDRTREIAQEAAVILGSWSRKAFRNKFYLYIMIGILLIANLFALIHIFTK